MARHSLCAFGLLALILAARIAPACAQNQPENAGATQLHAKLARDLEHIAADFDGVMGVAVKDLGGGESFGVNADTVFPQASAIKLPILLELYRQAQAGMLHLDERVEAKRAQTVGGSGALQYFGDGTSALSLRDLATLMIVLSDNSATNILIDRIGMANVNATLTRLGVPQVRLQRRMMDDDAKRANRENLSTPNQTIALLDLLYHGKALDQEHTAAVLEILKYPKDSPLRKGLPEKIALADKPGEMDGVRCDSGIVFLTGRPYIISVMTTYDKEGDLAGRAVGEVSRRVFEYFERLARSNVYGSRLP